MIAISLGLGGNKSHFMKTVPADIEGGLKSVGAYSAFCELGPAHQREYLQWITGTKRPETRKARIEKSAKMILEKCSAKRPRK